MAKMKDIEKYKIKVTEEYNKFAENYDKIKLKNETYYNELKSIFNQITKPKSSVLEIGCATGGILADTKPKKGVGIDISPFMIKVAKSSYPQYKFYCSSIEDIGLKKLKTKFDYILLPDVIEYFSDLDKAFSKIKKLCNKSTILIIASPSRIWGPALIIAEKLKLKMEDSCKKRSSKRKIVEMLKRNGFVVKEYYTRILVPKDLSINLLKAINKYFYKIPFLKELGLIRVFVVMKNE